jgi:GT2 family glycosyltransferase
MPKPQPKVAIIIIHYNTPHFLKTCLDHIIKQTYKNIDIYFIDNDSPDKTGLNFVKKEYGSPKANLKGKAIHIIPNKENLGYAKAANQGIHQATDADYIVITNPDIIYSPTYFEKIVARAEKAVHKQNMPLAGITGKVLKYDFENKKPTRIIDTIGLYISRGGRIKDGGQGHEDKGQFDEEKEVFGISGACPLYRKEALEEVRYKDEYFDEDFFMYKEDVDLSWRLQLLGFKFLYYPKALAFHGRGTGVLKRDSVKETFKNRKRLSKFQRTYSFRNHHLMLFKNLTLGNHIKNFFHLAARNVSSLLYTLVYEPFVLKSLVEYMKLLPKMMRKRRHLMKKKSAKSSRINRFMKSKP